jgi:hypothetical protein
MIEFDRSDEPRSLNLTLPKSKQKVRVVWANNIGRVYDAKTGQMLGHHYPFCETGATGKQLGALLDELGYR